MRGESERRDRGAMKRSSKKGHGRVRKIFLASFELVFLTLSSILIFLVLSEIDSASPRTVRTSTWAGSASSPAGAAIPGMDAPEVSGSSLLKVGAAAACLTNFA